MSTTFPRTRRSASGYNIEQVEDFLEEARRAYDSAQSEIPLLRASDIRLTAFSMQKGGYSPRHVDAALERLEDAFAARERDVAVATLGEEGSVLETRRKAQEILDRLSRPDHERFNRTGLFVTGYNCGEVDQFAHTLVAYFQQGTPVTVDQVRTAVFHPQRRGYDETQVDILLDAVIDVMLAVR